MPDNIINLRKVRKAKVRADHARQAAENRNAFGRTKANKQKDAIERQRAERLIEGHHLESDEN
jgi:Domain of unknown function (DUF4169)